MKKQMVIDSVTLGEDTLLLSNELTLIFKQLDLGTGLYNSLSLLLVHGSSHICDWPRPVGGFEAFCLACACCLTLVLDPETEVWSVKLDLLAVPYLALFT